jgi:hypothetical protein
MSLVRVIILLCLSSQLLSCAGPMGPFGTKLKTLSFHSNEKNRAELWSFQAGNWRNPSSKNEMKKAVVIDLAKSQDPEVSLDILPRTQRYHDAQIFQIILRDERVISHDYDLRVFYNERDVTPDFLKLATLTWSEDRKQLHLSFAHLRLPAQFYHDIIVTYERERHTTPKLTTLNEAPIYTKRLSPPSCSLKMNQSIVNAGTFQRYWGLLRRIESISVENGINPSLLAALVAQESSFNPKAVSTAKAIGLTQVTELAEHHILDQDDKKDWPSFGVIRQMSYPLLKASIMSGRINSKNEWRLHTDKSLKGGISYIHYLQDYWSIPEHWSQLEQSFGPMTQNSETLAEIILASYNSGPFRIKRAIAQSGAHWLDSPELGEARNYVRRVQSYCDHFSYLDI